MEQNIKACIKRHKENGNEEDFKAIYEYVLPDFRYWYRHVQRYTNNDRPTLLCEFQYILLKAVRGFDTDCPVPDGFIRYFRAALSKHAYTLRRIHRSTLPCHSMKQDWEVVDPKWFIASEELEILDLINVCYDGDERMIVLHRMMGEQADSIKEKLELSEFEYRKGVRNIKSNRRLEKALSRH